ncbi:MAG: hypothetical protein ACI9CF_002036 [Candidatus Omnitrophota bacterium]|jgi:hypothetical protein
MGQLERGFLRILAASTKQLPRKRKIGYSSKFDLERKIK